LYQIMSGARGFRDISDDTYFVRIETSVQTVFRGLTDLAHKWKVESYTYLDFILSHPRQAILPLTNYYNAVGTVTDTILLQMVDEIADLDDITEVESERLAQMCKQMEPIQRLFIDADGQVS
jgi:hypothetical protein